MTFAEYILKQIRVRFVLKIGHISWKLKAKNPSPIKMMLCIRQRVDSIGIVKLLVALLLVPK